MQALGMIETYGVIGAIEAADVMLKVADVSLIKKETVQGGLIMVSVEGDVAAVKTAVDAGASAVQRLGENFLYGAHVIPRPDGQMSLLYGGNEKEKLSPDNPTLTTDENEVVVDVVADYEKSLGKKRASELREMVANNENFVLTEDELLKLVKKEMIALLVSDFKAQERKDN